MLPTVPVLPYRSESHNRHSFPIVQICHPPATLQQRAHIVSFVDIAGGPVQIGTDTGYADEGPTYVTNVRPFAIGVHPVTNRDYAAFLRTSGYAHLPHYWHDQRFNHPMQPVVGVTWNDATAYCEWLTRHLAPTGALAGGKGVRLPSEEEWEKAAAWDPDNQRSRRYPWGDVWEPGRAYTATEAAVFDPAPVGHLSAGMSAYGVYDMLGNVWEWTSSIYRSYPNAPTPFCEADRYVLRGGSSTMRPTHLRCTYRCRLPANYWRYHLGFRIIIGLPG